MYTNSFSLEIRQENDVLASVHFIIFEIVIKNIPIFGNQLWTVASSERNYLLRTERIIYVNLSDYIGSF